MLDQLQKIGLTSGEARVYETLVKLGPSTKTPISKSAEVSPGKVYDILERLKRKGLVSNYTEGRVKHFRAAEPKELMRYVELKRKELDQETNIIEQLIPKLLLMQSEKETTAEIFSGWSGMTTCYNKIFDVLKKGDEDLVFGATAGAIPEQTALFFSNFNAKRYDKGIRLKIIYNDQDKKLAQSYINNTKFDEVRFLPFQAPAEINIFGDYVMIIILAEKPTAFLLKSEQAATSFRSYFNILWDQARP